MDGKWNIVLGFNGFECVVLLVDFRRSMIVKSKPPYLIDQNNK